VLLERTRKRSAAFIVITPFQDRRARMACE
jgi:hypothetical protein